MLLHCIFDIVSEGNKQIQAMDPPASPLRKKRAIQRRLQKLLKQQQQHQEKREFEPGKVELQSTDRCKLRVVNFFGDVHTEVYCLHTSPNNENVAVGCSNGDLKVYNIYEGKILLMGNTSRLSGYPNTAVRWHPKSNRELAACNCDGTIKWYDMDNEVAFDHHDSETGYLCLDYNCDGSWNVLGNEKHELEIYDGKTKKLMLKYEAGHIDSLNPNHTNRIFCVKGIKNEPNLFFSGGWDGSVRLWDVRVPESSVRKFGGPMVSADSLDLKGNVLLAGNYATKEIVQLWDFSTGKLISTLDLQEPPTATAYCFAATYAHQSKYNLSAAGFSGINKIKIFEGEKMVGEMRMQAAPLCISFYRFNDKDFMVASGVEGTIYALKVKVMDKN